MQSGRFIPREVILILSLFLLFFLVSALTVHPTIKERTHYLSTNEDGPYGLSRLLDLTQNLNLSAEPYTTEFNRENLKEVGLIFTLAPEISFKNREKKTILEWIKNGGTLVYGYDVAPIIDNSLAREMNYVGGDFPVNIYHPKPSKLEIKTDETPIMFTPPQNKADSKQIKMSVVTPIKLNRAFRNVGQIHAPLFINDGKLYRISYKREFLKEEEITNASEQDFPLPFIEQDKTDSNKKTKAEDLSEWMVLANDGEQASIIGKQIGKGWVIAISNPLIFANGYLDAGDNSIFAINLVSLAKSGEKCIFDEVHHGFRPAGNFNIATTGWGRSLICILAIGLLAVYSRAVRFIPPRSFPPPERRSQVEYLRSMANVLRRAHAFKLTSEIIIKDIRSRHEMDSDIHQCIEATMASLAKDKASETETLNAVRSILEKCDKTQSKLYRSTRHD